MCTKRKFLSTLSLRRATPRDCPASSRRRYFYPRSPCGERRGDGKAYVRDSLFLSTLSLRRATCGVCWQRHHRDHFYPRSPCGERPPLHDKDVNPDGISIRALLAESDAQKRYHGSPPTGISIHALLAESDQPRKTEVPGARISIHALLAESDPKHFLTRFSTFQFLSTLSLRRATGRAGRPPARLPDFYPRSPCGERLGGRCCCKTKRGISIHALLAESDWAVGAAARPREVFLSTLSLRRATGCGLPQCHAGCDFYPRSPCGERRNNSNNELVCTVFLSTLSLRRATPAALPSKSATGFLSTLSLRRATISDTATSVGNWVFLSTLSLRRATTSLSWNRCARAFLSTLSLRRATDGRQPNVFLVDISIHALLAESDRGQDKHESRRVISIHALLAESDGGKRQLPREHADFYPRSPCGERPTAAGAACKGFGDFYPRSPCGERLSFIIYSITDNCISIHALLAESDSYFCGPAV